MGEHLGPYVAGHPGGGYIDPLLAPETRHLVGCLSPVACMPAQLVFALVVVEPTTRCHA